MIKISAITVTFNSIKTIADTLNSVATQAYSKVEHLVIDGTSQDGTVDLVRKFSNLKIRLISEKDNGIYDAMNNVSVLYI